MIFKQLFDDESSTYTYLLADEASKEAIIIDSVKEHVDEYLKLLDELGLRLKYCLDTHVHADHVTGAADLREKTGCQTALQELTQATCVDIRLKDGETLQFGPYQIRTLHTPGHTPCHAAYLIDDRVFTGDALFINGCGRTDFQCGDAGQLWDSVTKKLFSLPSETQVYPGHDYHGKHVSTIQQEIEHNPRFKDQTRETFIELMNALDLPMPKKIMEAVPANEACGRGESTPQ